MPKRDRFKNAKARRESGGFVALTFVVLRSDQWAQLSSQAVKLLCDLLSQYRGDNNGDLCAAWRLMKKRGWKSKDTLSKALNELRKDGWLELTRQGGRHVANLYAVSFFAIDDCKGKLDVKATGSPSGAWHKNAQVFELPKLKVVPRRAYQFSSDCPAQRINSK